MPEYIKKRDGRLVPYDEAKIASAIDRAFVAAESGKGEDEADRLAKIVTREMNAKENNETPSVEDIQDQVERVLIAEGYAKTAKAYILYRAERSRTREAKTRLMHILEDITFKDASESDVKRENANIDGDTAMGTMLKYGSESAKQFYDMYVLNPKHARAPRGRHPHPRPRLPDADDDLHPDRPDAAFQGRFFDRPRRAARAAGHRQLFRAGLHRYPEQPERSARRSGHRQL